MSRKFVVTVAQRNNFNTVQYECIISIDPTLAAPTQNRKFVLQLLNVLMMNVFIDFLPFTFIKVRTHGHDLNSSNYSMHLNKSYHLNFDTNKHHKVIWYKY